MRFLVITDDAPLVVGGRFGLAVGIVRTLGDIDATLPLFDAAVLDADRLTGLGDMAALCEFVCAVRYRAAYHHRPVVAVTTSWVTAQWIENSRVAVCATPGDALRFLSSWDEAEERRGQVTGYRGQGGRLMVAPVGSNDWKPLGQLAGDVSIRAELTPGPGWAGFVRELMGDTPVAVRSGASELERELIDLTRLAMEAPTETVRKLALDMAGRIKAQYPQISQISQKVCME